MGWVGRRRVGVQIESVGGSNSFVRRERDIDKGMSKKLYILMAPLNTATKKIFAPFEIGEF